MANHTVLITGGSRGIGAAIAEELSAAGYRVLTPSRSELDLSENTAIDSYVQGLKSEPIDILVNNAGINLLQKIGDIDEKTWSAMLQTNLSSALWLSRALMPRMSEMGWGRILNVSTIFGHVTKESRAAYSMTKAALNALTRSAAVEYGQYGILVNSLAPGYVNTVLTKQNNSPEDLEKIISTIPLHRMAESSELAKIAAFLVSENNTYITGQVIVADGGFTCL
jgi:3-oxoacyl-[acyl-carrier protein] reductase